MNESLTRAFHRGTLVLQKNSPEILLAAGIIGGIAAAILAAKATKHLDDVMEIHHMNKDVADMVLRKAEEDDNVDIPKEEAIKQQAIVYVGTGLRLTKLYGPSIALGAASIAAILYSHGIMKNRQVALVAAYNVLAEGYNAYRKQVIEKFGEAAETELRHNVAEAEETEFGEAKPTAAYSIYSRFFDEYNPMWKTDRQMNKAFLLSEQNHANDLLQIQGHVFLNQIYERLGFPHTPYGQLVGWVLKSPKEMEVEDRDGYIDFGITNMSHEASREFINGQNPSVLLDFNVDGIVFDLI